MKTCVLITTMILACARAEAGSEGTLIVSIHEWDGSPLSGWTVRLNGNDAGQSNDKGIAQIRASVGTYRVDIQDPDGKVRAIYENVRVFPGATRNLDVPINTETSEIETVDADKMQTLGESPYPQHVATSNHLRTYPGFDLTRSILSASPDVSWEDERAVTDRVQFENLPILRDVIKSKDVLGQPHVTLRGSQSHEIAWVLDGRVMNDPMSGRPLMELPHAAVDYVIIDAAHHDVSIGNHGSGAITMVPHRASNRLHLAGGIRTDQVPGFTGYGQRRLDFLASGPLAGDRVRMVVAGEFHDRDDANPAVFGQAKFTLSTNGTRNLDPTLADTVLFSGKYNDGARADRANARRDLKIYGNLSWSATSKLNFDARTLINSIDENVFLTEYTLTPKGAPLRERTLNWFTLDGTYRIGQNTSASVGLSYTMHDSRMASRRAFDDLNHDLNALAGSAAGNTGFVTYYNDNIFYDIGRDFQYYERMEDKAFGLRASVWSAFTPVLEGTAGISYESRTIRSASIYDLDNPLNGANDIYGWTAQMSGSRVVLKKQDGGLDGAKTPSTFALFGDGTLRATEMVTVHGGLRWNRFSFGLRPLKNIANPTGGDGLLGPEDYGSDRAVSYLDVALGGSLKFDIVVLRAGLTSTGQLPPLQTVYGSSGFLERMSIAPPFAVPVGSTQNDYSRTTQLNLGGTLKNGSNDLSFETAGDIYFKAGQPLEWVSVISTPNSLVVRTFHGDYSSIGIAGTLRIQLKDRMDYKLNVRWENSILNAEATRFRSGWLGSSDTKLEPPNPSSQTFLSRAALTFYFLPGPSAFYTTLTSFFQTGYRYTGTTVVPYQVTGVPAGRVTTRLYNQTTPASLSMDWKIAKTFAFNKTNITGYVQILNIFNAKNPVNVFSSTGEGDDNGFLDTPAGQSLSLRQFAQYDIRNHESFHYAPPRQIFVGLNFEY